jgi:thiol-disulfide isomerase/thioredoxin
MAPNTTGKTGFGGGVVIGLSLGLLWTPCVGPILASVISLAITGTVTTDAFFITLAYAVGTAIPMLIVILGGQKILTTTPWLLRNTHKIQKAFGIIMILTAIGIYNGVDRTFQTYILTTFPNYGVGLTKFEDNELVKDKLVDHNDVAPELILGGEWFNSKPLSIKELRGKVVLVDFWTYTCINCQRTFPYLKDWDKKYRDQGLVIIGVHSPEFEFEKDAGNVKEAISDFGLTYPVMQDNNFATWKAYQNKYWPAKYLIDKDGKIRYTHFGEGDYDETESMIQKLLSIDMPIANPTYRTYGRTPELYLGSERYAPSSPITREGKWSASKEYAIPTPGSTMTVSYNAKSVYLVMRPVTGSAQVEVYLDGQYQKTITVDKDTLYTLVDLESPGSHELRLVFPSGNLELFAFTFG